MKIYWHLSPYISHRKAGLAYQRYLPLAGLNESSSPADADVAVLHEEPKYWPQLFATFPELSKKPVIGYAVWEGATLPEIYRPGLRLVREVWTASAFSAQALQQGHSRVRVLPHVVEPILPTEDDRAWASSLCGPEPYFFSIMDAVNPRKNLEALLRAFMHVRAVYGKTVRLVVKQYRIPVDLGQLPDVLSLEEQLTDGRLAALHQGALAYVSPHRGEAWGLGLSEAMSQGTPVLATGWSGNMEFMDGENSIPLRYRLVPVGEDMSNMLPHFRPDMLWAEVDENHLEGEMLRLLRRGKEPEMCRKAAGIVQRFSPLRIARKIRQLVEDAR